MAQLTLHRYSVNLVTQGKHKFYSLTIPSDVLAETTFVRSRDEDPDEGFQRTLDETRARQIADYMDNGVGTIPTSIVLSAQPDAQLKLVDGSKTLEFRAARKAFLIIDGQHRVYGFKLASTKLRVPVVIYDNLTKSEEAKLFIDINTKQRPVSNELLLDIKKMAEYENHTEKLFGEVFDLFAQQPDSPIRGDLSPRSRKSGKISRVTFNAALKPINSAFQGANAFQIYDAMKGYCEAFKASCSQHGDGNVFLNPIVFRAAMLLFTEVARSVKDRNLEFNADNYYDALTPMFDKIPFSKLKRPGKSPVELFNEMSRYLRRGFTLREN